MELDGRQLLAGLADCTLPPAQFSHRNHVRAAWQCLRERPLPEAAEHFAGLLQAYVKHLNAQDKYHHTLTLALMHLIHRRMQLAPTGDWDAFTAANADLFSDAKALIGRHYSAQALGSDAARRGFVEPDLAALP